MSIKFAKSSLILFPNASLKLRVVNHFGCILRNAAYFSTPYTSVKNFENAPPYIYPNFPVGYVSRISISFHRISLPSIFACFIICKVASSFNRPSPFTLSESTAIPSRIASGNVDAKSEFIVTA